MTKFSENFKAALAGVHMSQTELAKRLNTTQQTVSRWILGKTEPDFSTLIKICCIVGETPNSILGFDDLPKEVKSNFEK